MVPGPVKLGFTCYCPEKASVLVIHNTSYDTQSLLLRAKPFSRRGNLVVLEQDIETGSFREIFSLPSDMGENGDPPLPLVLNEYVLSYEDRFEEDGQTFIKSIKSIQVFDVWTRQGRYPTKSEIEDVVRQIKDDIDGYVVFLNGERVV